MIGEPEIRPAWRGRGPWRGWRAAKRERRRAEARVSPAKPLDSDGIAAALAARERAIMAAWRDRS